VALAADGNEDDAVAVAVAVADGVGRATSDVVAGTRSSSIRVNANGSGGELMSMSWKERSIRARFLAGCVGRGERCFSVVESWCWLAEWS